MRAFSFLEGGEDRPQLKKVKRAAVSAGHGDGVTRGDILGDRDVTRLRGGVTRGDILDNRDDGVFLIAISAISARKIAPASAWMPLGPLRPWTVGAPPTDAPDPAVRRVRPGATEIRLRPDFRTATTGLAPHRHQRQPGDTIIDHTTIIDMMVAWS